MQLRDFRVLAVDDSAATLRLITEIARAVGVGEINTRLGALDALNALNDLRPDVLLVDWQMPGVDGLMLTKIIRDAALNPDPMIPDPTVPIIMITGRRREVDVEAARLSGATDFIIKPFTADALMSRLLAAVNRSRGFVIAEQFVGPDRRRHKADAHQGPRRRIVDPNADGAASSLDPTRQALRRELIAIRDLQARGGSERDTIAMCYESARGAVDRARTIRNTAIEQASHSLVRYVEAVGGPQNADAQVVNVHMDALGKLLVLGDGSRAAAAVNARLDGAANRKLGATAST